MERHCPHGLPRPQTTEGLGKMSQNAKRYRPRTRAGIRTDLNAREYAHEVYRYTRKGA